MTMVAVTDLAFVWKTLDCQFDRFTKTRASKCFRHGEDKILLHETLQIQNLYITCSM